MISQIQEKISHFRGLKINTKLLQKLRKRREETNHKLYSWKISTKTSSGTNRQAIRLMSIVKRAVKKWGRRSSLSSGWNIDRVEKNIKCLRYSTSNTKCTNKTLRKGKEMTFLPSILLVPPIHGKNFTWAKTPQSCSNWYRKKDRPPCTLETVLTNR